MAKTIDYLRELASSSLPREVTPERYETAKLLSVLGWITIDSQPPSGMRADGVTFAGQAVLSKAVQLQQLVRSADPPSTGSSSPP